MDDLLAVWDGVYEASKEASVADKYVADFLASISQKRDFPLSGIPLHYRGLFTGFYSVNFKKYKAFYRVKDGYLEVIRIFLAKTDYLQVLFPEEAGL